MALTKCKLKKGDLVIVTAGKDKGKTGKILQVIKSDERVLVEGINIVTKHKKSENQENKQPNIIKKEATIHISNVMYYSASQKKGVRLAYKTDANNKVRIIAKTKEEIK
jgi:large subunit ribosomal protein L24